MNLVSLTGDVYEGLKLEQDEVGTSGNATLVELIPGGGDCGSLGVLEAQLSIYVYIRTNGVRTNVVLAHDLELQNSLQLLRRRSIELMRYLERP